MQARGRIAKQLAELARHLRSQAELGNEGNVE